MRHLKLICLAFLLLASSLVALGQSNRGNFPTAPTGPFAPLFPPSVSGNPADNCYAVGGISNPNSTVTVVAAARKKECEDIPVVAILQPVTVAGDGNVVPSGNGMFVNVRTGQSQTLSVIEGAYIVTGGIGLCTSESGFPSCPRYAYSEVPVFSVGKRLPPAPYFSRVPFAFPVFPGLASCTESCNNRTVQFGATVYETTAMTLLQFRSDGSLVSAESQSIGSDGSTVTSSSFVVTLPASFSMDRPVFAILDGKVGSISLIYDPRGAGK